MKIIHRIFYATCLILVAGVSHGETLLDIYEQALDNDPQLKADRAAYEANKEAINVARANLLPQISAGADYSDTTTDTKSSGTVVVGGGFSISSRDYSSDSNSTSYSVSLRQPLFNLSAWYGYKQGGVNTEKAEYDFKANQQALIIRVSQAYFQVLRAIDNLKTAQAQETALASQLEQTQQRFEVGLTAITDVLDAQSTHDSATAAVFDARGQLGIAYEALEVLTGQPYDTIAPIVDSFPVTDPTPSDRESWVNFALENNNDLASAKLTAEAARYGAKASKSNHYPTLSGALTYSNSDSETDSDGSISDSTTDRSSVTISLDIPIYTGGRTSAQRRQAYQTYMRAEDLYSLTQRNTIQSTRSLHLAVTTNVAQVAARRQAIISATSALEATQAGYEVGTRNLVDVLLSQRTLFQAQRDYSNALYDYVINSLKLKQAAGTLSAQDIIELNQWLDEQNQITRESVEQ